MGFGLVERAEGGRGEKEQREREREMKWNRPRKEACTCAHKRKEGRKAGKYGDKREIIGCRERQRV